MLFDQKYSGQIDPVAMGSPLGPTLANIFQCHHETTWLKNCPKAIKPVYYERYVNDIFCTHFHKELGFKNTGGLPPPPHPVFCSRAVVMFKRDQ